MTKNHNMGRKSHKVQDAEYKQNMAGIDDEITNQRIKPTLGKQQVTKSSKEEPRQTK